jgi:hypothetical protein
MTLHVVVPPGGGEDGPRNTGSEAAYMRGLIDGMERARLEAEAQQPPPTNGNGHRLSTPGWWLAFLTGVIVVLMVAATSLVLHRIDESAQQHRFMLEVARSICLAPDTRP